MRNESKHPPMWAVILDAANGDPLRAQEIEQHLSAEWFFRFVEYRKAQSKVK